MRSRETVVPLVVDGSSGKASQVLKEVKAERMSFSSQYL